ncbi:MAG: HD-GYP domain-containing protein [Alteromonadaceae bacterium]|nr:HD-GYP domain-containing protein [Alteromonadaceae bacterium]
MFEEKEITELVPGQYVIEIAKQNGSFSLSSPGHIKNQAVINHLKSKGVVSVLIDPKKTLKKNIENNNENGARKLLIKEVKEAKEIFNESKKIQRRVFDDALSGTELDLTPVIEITNKSVDAIFNNPDSLACIVNIREKDEYLLEHSVSVAIYMAIFARYLKIKKSIVQELSIGAFLHDVGKIMVPDEILNKPGKLTNDEFTIMKTHANHSIDIITKTPGISKLSLEVAALHHEKINGEGYPFNVKGDDVTKFGRMIAICDIFDALTADRCYKEGFSHIKSFAILRELAQQNHLDIKLVDTFIKCAGVFPVGSLVKLKSNKIAIVEERNPNDPTKPKVKSFYSAKMNHYINTQKIDLQDSKDEIVKGVRAKDFDLDMNKIVEMLLMQG